MCENQQNKEKQETNPLRELETMSWEQQITQNDYEDCFEKKNNQN